MLVEEDSYPKSPKSQQEDLLDKGFKILLFVLILTFLFILLVSYPAGYPNPPKWQEAIKLWGRNSSLLMFVCAAALTSGGLVGFLFGIPRILQKGDGNSDGNGNGFLQNTNLEQISDWLTKILVGVSLVEIKPLLASLDRLVAGCASGLLMLYATAYATSYALIVLFSMCGFLFGYLWTRVRLLQVFVDLNRSLTPIEKRLEDLSNNLKAQDERYLNRRRQTLTSAESDIPDELLAKLAPITNAEDPQKGRFGGKDVVDGRKMYANITEIVSGLTYEVKLTVESTDENKPLVDPVFFFLHDTMAQPIVKATVEENVATHTVRVYEAFTVGAICDNGNTLLELDLNAIPDAPPGFKY
ncbi:MAG: pYEATS domain-containing protein [Chitinophagales bacterium]|nr:pYEATS domain-containing protein [Chitinophagales bacterium]